MTVREYGMTQILCQSQDEVCLTASVRIVPEEGAWANHSKGLHLSPWLPQSQFTHQLASQGSVSSHHAPLSMAQGSHLVFVLQC